MKFKYALALPLAALFVLPTAMSASAAPIVTPTAFVTLPSGSNPHDIALCGGKVFTANQASGTVSAITTTGTVSSYDVSNRFPASLVCSPTGTYLYELPRYTPTYPDVYKIARITVSSGVVDPDFAVFSPDIDYPYGPMITDPEGNIFVMKEELTDEYGGDSHIYLAKITPNGVVNNRFADFGRQQGGRWSLTRSPGDIDDIYVGNLDRLFKANAGAGTVTRLATVADGVGGIVTDQNDNLFVATNAGAVAKYASDGTLLDAAFSHFPGGADGFVLQRNGNFYVTGTDSREITAITPTGRSFSLASLPSSANPLRSVVSADGIVYTVSDTDRTIYRIDLNALAPRITSTAPYGSTRGFGFGTVVEADGTNVTYSVAGGSLPPGFTLDSTSGLLQGPPYSAPAGTYPFDIVATNPFGSDTQHVDFHVV